jgi:CRISPR-associated RAMP protein (TIGR02581 family)
MLKTILNECLIDFSIKSETPLLIKSGMERVEDPDMFPVRTFRIRNGKGDKEVFIPGSSLKGVIRSHSERITRTLCQGKEPACCNPFERDKENKNKPDFACSNYFEEYKQQEKIKKLNGIEAYRQSCLICRLFGSTENASRLIVRDAYLKDGCNVKFETRTGVGIDRFTGGASKGALFSLEVATNAEFGTQLYIRNFELWQLGLLAYVFQDFKDGIIPIGYGKSRGFGKVTGIVDKVEVRYLGQNTPSAPNIRGIRKMVEENGYGFYEEENKDFKVEGLSNFVPDDFGLRRTYVFGSESEIQSLWKTAAPLWNNCVNDYKSERVKLE